ncbi:MAG: 16S rRNA (guanine(527)-N(7))-methyltransferase RsmG [Victivallaceae bacterium]|nr:16S rRNA (guanine(527)-N(7))-methyltransferase RsmG [Victivallaceae bacterium]
MIDSALFGRFSPPDGFAGKCRELYALLIEANAVTNLTRIDSEAGFAVKHVLDSLYILDFFPFLTADAEKISLADVGCGAGFPSLVLALCRPELKITAIDSTGKKIAFVRLAAERLGLANLTAVQGRTREMACRPEWKGRFDVITARAVGAAPLIVVDAEKMLKPSGRFILYKTPNQAAAELPELKKLKPARPWRQTAGFQLPDDSGDRCFLYF